MGRRIGQGMKPRETANETPTTEGQVNTTETTVSPTTEGQPESIIQPVLDRQQGEQSGGGLELQNLDSPKVADEPKKCPRCGIGIDDNGDGDCGHCYKLTDEELEEINKLTDKISAEAISEATGLPMDEIEAALAKSAPQMQTGSHAKVVPECIHSVPVSQVCNECMKVAIENNARMAKHLGVSSLGQQSNGDLNVIATIPEEYVEAVKQWAESEDKTVQEWMNGALQSYLESWGSPAGKR